MGIDCEEYGGKRSYKLGLARELKK